MSPWTTITFSFHLLIKLILQIQNWGCFGVCSSDLVNWFPYVISCRCHFVVFFLIGNSKPVSRTILKKGYKQSRRKKEFINAIPTQSVFGGNLQPFQVIKQKPFTSVLFESKCSKSAYFENGVLRMYIFFTRYQHIKNAKCCIPFYLGHIKLRLLCWIEIWKTGIPRFPLSCAEQNLLNLETVNHLDVIVILLSLTHHWIFRSQITPFSIKWPNIFVTLGLSKKEKNLVILNARLLNVGQLFHILETFFPRICEILTFSCSFECSDPESYDYITSYFPFLKIYLHFRKYIVLTVYWLGKNFSTTDWFICLIETSYILFRLLGTCLNLVYDAQLHCDCLISERLTSATR